MKHLLYIFLTAGCIVSMASCGGSKGSSHSAQAQSRAMQIADELVSADTTDTMEVQSALIHAESVRSEYLLMGDTAAANDFDNAYRAAVAQKRPYLAREIFDKPK